MASRPCRDCGSTSRKTSAPGPRCATCHRTRKKALKEAAHGRWTLKTYGITSDQYWALYGAQGGTCYICQRAKGTTKKLAVDHDHATGYVRGLLCGPCNKVIGHFRDDKTTAYRAFNYLVEPPAFGVIGKVKPDEADD